jgi:uncharacterized tellurite resistance protein B-like protein
MFLHQLNDEQRALLVTLATRMIVVDNVVALQEIAAMNDLLAEVGNRKSDEQNPSDRATILRVFNDKRSRVLAAFELLFIAHVDENFHPAEGDLFKQICDDFGFTSDEYDNLVRLADGGAEVFNGLRTLCGQTAESLLTG